MNAREFSRRRRALMRMVGRDGVVIIPAAPTRTRNRDVEYIYRQDSDFYYLSGFREPEAVLVLLPGRSAGEYVLFCRDRDPARETWDGARVGVDAAPEVLGVDDAFPIEDIDDILPGLLEGRSRVHYAMGLQPDFDARLMQWMARASRGRPGELPHEFVSLEHTLHDMRLYKSRSEVALMRRAARLAATAHVRAMQACLPGAFEYEIEAELMHTFRRGGARVSYPPIVASGANACTLHYIDNEARCEDGDLLLIDAGCELEYYASDITRTFPVNGRFSDEQRAIYQLVLDAQYAALAAVRPGEHWNAPHEAAVKVITRGLVRLGLLKGTPSKLIREEAYRALFMHRTGHWLGIDVHDVGDYKVGNAWRELEAGMVLTVEPGIYIAPGSPGVPRRWQGIGVRIEDDVLVTADGHEVLSAGVPKEIDEIEALMAQAAEARADADGAASRPVRGGVSRRRRRRAVAS